MSEAKKIKLSADFTESGRFEDEITLKFDDGKELFVSKSFLCMASPVFDAMLTRDFIEKESKTIKMVGKKSGWFLQFLLCIHPAVMEPVTKSSVIKVAQLAEEYQHDALILHCKKSMTTMLDNAHTNHSKVLAKKDKSKKWKCINCVGLMLSILSLSSKLNYDAIKLLALDYLGKCSHIYYTGATKWYKDCLLPEEGKKHIAITRHIYQSLPEVLKNQVLLQRLENVGH